MTIPPTQSCIFIIIQFSVTVILITAESPFLLLQKCTYLTSIFLVYYNILNLCHLFFYKSVFLPFSLFNHISLPNGVGKLKTVTVTVRMTLRRQINYLCTYALYSPVHNVLDVLAQPLSHFSKQWICTLHTSKTLCTGLYKS